ncbi:hypothetical protein M9Y10_012129 [Tritrichomonas musculus]|uniref:Uncharacterized protein n=1 Tax=Tritrichomonas musculus TaxID=1915356 RepID=A0ABR2ICU0_9EUKA
MSKVLHKARILSSENDSSCKQEQNTNVNIKIKPSSNVNYPNIPPISAQIQNQPYNVNQEQQLQQDSLTRNINFTQLSDNSQLAYQQQINNTLEIRNKFLETLLSIYELNPLRINNYLVCHYNSLMELIKILTQADKVELVIDEEEGCTCCISNTKYMNIQRILVTKDDKTLDLKIGYNETYAQLIRYGISLKMCI